MQWAEGDLGINVRVLDDRVVIGLVGDLDLATEPRLHSIVSRLLDEGVRDLVFDWVDLEFVDSTGLALVAWACREGVRITVARPSRAARRLLELTGLDGLVEIVDGEPDPG